MFVQHFFFLSFVFWQVPPAADEIIKKCHVHETQKSLTLADASNSNATQLGNTNSNLGPVHYLHELPHAEEERYAQLFSKLDRKGEVVIV